MNTQTQALQSFENTISKSTKNLEEVLSELQETTEKVERTSSLSVCPIDVLPEPSRKLIEELHNKYKFPKDFCLMYVLWVASVAAGNNYRAQVKRNWLEPVLLYMAIVALAGQTKTPVQNQLTQVLREINKRFFEKYSAEVQDQEDRKRLATKEQPFNEKKPIRKQIIIQDSTQEATIKALYNNQRGLGVLFDELAGFFGNMNRYNSGSEMPFYLSAYNCQSYSSNRKTTEDVYLSDPFLCIIGGIQPAILSKTFSDEMQDNGAKDRFLFCYPEGLKKEIPTDEEINQDLLNHYTETIRFLMYEGDRELAELRKYEKDTNYLIVDFEPQARKVLFQYLEINAEEVNRFNEEGEYRLASTFSKYDYHVIRLSFIIQLLHDASNRQITKVICTDSVNKGIRLANYFKWHSKRVHSLISGDPLASLDQTKRDLINALPDGDFSLSEAIETAKDVRAADLDQGLTLEAVEKWVKRFLTTRYFTKPKHGIYSKNRK
jgi:hypothetical protein